VAGQSGTLSQRYQGVLDAITRVRGVRGAMMVERHDGLVVADALMDGVHGTAVAALAASLFHRLGNATIVSGVGEPRFMQLQATDGTLLALVAGPDVLIVSITEATSNVGLVRLEMLRAAEVVE
jgi:predicted regulator of Ras-like GTPase activity (Roadblock/LC7/MglB family)